MATQRINYCIIVLGCTLLWLLQEVSEASKLLKCECGIHKDKRRIVNGKPADENEFPWVALIIKNGNIHCAGSIINDRYVLTAGHCVYKMKLKEIRVVLAAHDLKKKTRNATTPLVKPQKFILHKNYISREDHDFHDVALIRLKGRIKFNDRIMPVCLPPMNSDPSNKVATIAGWGRTGVLDDPSYILLKADVDTMSQEKCLEVSYYEKEDVLEDNFCARREGTDSCAGDSGGPIMYKVPGTKRKMQQIGIVSWGNLCAEEVYPGVYVKLSMYISWIAKNTKDASYCKR